MKRTIMSIAMLVGVLTASSVVANDGMKIVELRRLTSAADLHVQALEGLKFRLSFDNTSKKSYIVLKDSKGDILFSEYANKDVKYAKIFDLSNLVDGSYSFEVMNGSDKIVKDFKIATKVNRVSTL